MCGGVAYTVHNQGYNTFDLADPAKPVLLATGRTPQFGWLHVVPNGSGLGLAAVGPTSGGYSPRDISLYDVRVPRTNDVFLTTFVTPGIARAVDAAKVAEKLRQAVANMAHPGRFGWRTTVSIGVATFPQDGRVARALVDTADAALYAAKARGRNQVVTAGEAMRDSMPSAE